MEQPAPLRRDRRIALCLWADYLVRQAEARHDVEHVGRLAHLLPVEQTIVLQAGSADEDGNAGGGQSLQAVEGLAFRAGELHAAVEQHDAPKLKADGDDMAFVTVSLTDAKGILIPDASDQLKFEVSGAGSFEAVCNGDATSLEPFKQPTMKLFNGQLVVIVRAAKTPGIATLKVTDKKRNISKILQISVE